MDKLTILYDGECYLCENRVKHFIKKDSRGLLKALDYTKENLDFQKYHLTYKQIDGYMHSFDESDNVYAGVDTFIEIFKRLDQYRWATLLLRISIFRSLFKVLYHVFAKYIRPKLPKKKCTNSTCQ